MIDPFEFSKYLTIGFLAILVMAMIIGYLRGTKKSLFSLIVNIIFIAFFFLTINTVVKFLYDTPIPYLSMLTTQIGLSIDTTNLTVSEVVHSFATESIGAEIGNLSPNLIAFLDAVVLFVLKIVYAIIYFTLIQIIYKFIMFIIGLIFLRNKKKRKKTVKSRITGTFIGLSNGLLTIFVLLIFFGGLVNILSNGIGLIDNVTNSGIVDLEYKPREELYDIHSSVIEMADIPSEPSEMLNLIKGLTNAYYSNPFIIMNSKIQIPIEESEEKEELSLYLFDEVLSMEYKEERIAFREELLTVFDTVEIALDTGVIQSKDIKDLTGNEVRDIFDSISQSNLLKTIIPLSIEVGLSMLSEEEIDIDTDSLYEIEWETELMLLGEIGASTLDILHAANLFEKDPDLSETTFDGDEIEGIFTEIGQSELVNLAAYNASQPLLEMLGDDIESIIYIPDDIVWEEEFSAIGSIVGEFFNTGIKIGDLESGDPMKILTTVAGMDFTTILNSQIITNALINILKGDTAINLNIQGLVIPTDILWLDELDDDGNIINFGELRNILLAINSLSTQLENIDFEDLGINTISELDADAINAIFESKILIASITEVIKTMNLGEYNLIIPDDVFDLEGYIKKIELESLVDATIMAAKKLKCDDGDEECEVLGFDITKVTNLEGTDIDTMLVSKILSATVGNLLIDLSQDMLVIPNSTMVEILVSNEPLDIVGALEIKNILLAVGALGITDINDIEITPELLNNIALASDPSKIDPVKSEKLFASKIINATISDMLIDMTTGEEQVLVIPYTSYTDLSVRYFEDEDLDIEYISEDELTNVLEAILALELTSFDDFEQIEDFDIFIKNSEVILNSAILHATVSKQIIDLSPDTITVPYYDEDAVSIRVMKGVVGKETEYILKDELNAIFDALSVLNITTIEDISEDINLTDVLADEANYSILLGSAIVQTIVSEQLIQLNTDETLTVPYFAEDNLTEIRKTVGVDSTSTEYIVYDELYNILKALNVLGITDITTFDGKIDLSLLNAPEARADVLGSSVIQATISDKVIELETTDGTLVVPYLAEDNLTEIRKTVGVDSTSTEYIVYDELDQILIA
ncbi:MAG: hypothetical protein PHF05_06355, partial [Candidatus Izemoplasmatales bacterium]|nr:hypothetical protein [Candidatus Izemoplasmatales bacterium]